MTILVVSTMIGSEVLQLLHILLRCILKYFSGIKVINENVLRKKLLQIEIKFSMTDIS